MAYSCWVRTSLGLHFWNLATSHPKSVSSNRSFTISNLSTVVAFLRPDYRLFMPWCAMEISCVIIVRL